ncbi:MAG: energy-coupling factor transporter transmembrane component T [Acidobacteriota bacterium]
MILTERKEYWLDKIDPRVKIVSLLASFIIALIPSKLLPVALVLAFFILLSILSNTFLFIRKLKFILVLIFLLSVVLWVLAKGKSYFLYGIIIGIKMDAMVIAGVAFLFSTKSEMLTLGLKKMGLPYPLSFAFSLSLRFVPTFMGIVDTIVQAQKSRGYIISTKNPAKKIKSYVPFLAPVFLNFLRWTEYLSISLESKGFGYSKKRKEYIELKLNVYDVLFLMCFLLSLGFLLWMRFKNSI